LKRKKEKKEKNICSPQKNYFRNSVTIVMIIEGKRINFKVSRNGKFQITGSKTARQAEKCVEYTWGYIKDLENVFTKPEDGKIKAYYVPSMRNIDFSLDFLIDRQKLDEYFNRHTPYTSLLETSIGYTGVNIKIPLCKPIGELLIKQMEYTKGKWETRESIDYYHYLDMLPEKEKIKKHRKKRYNTFLVFHSGKIIFSGLEETFMEETYYEFLDIIRECYDVIREQLEE